MSLHHRYNCRVCGDPAASEDQTRNVCVFCYIDLGTRHLPDDEEYTEVALLAQMSLPGPLLPHARRGVNLNQMHD